MYQVYTEWVGEFIEELDVRLRCISYGSVVGYLRNPKRPLCCCLMKMNEKPVTDHVEGFTALVTGQIER
jgi:hypothetical protein